MNESIETMPSGREMLKKLEAENKYVFHGSENPDIGIMEPRQAYNHRDDGTKEKDGEPGVFASDRADYAILMALINIKNCPNGFDSVVGSRIDNGIISLSLKTTQEGIEELNEESGGCVYVFDKALFQQKGRGVQFVTNNPVMYVDKIRVTKADLPPDLEITDL